MQQQKRWDPEHYYKHSATQRGHAKDLLAHYQFRGDEQILDVGCGDGKITAALSQHIPNGHITGIDKSEEMLAFAKQTFSPENFTHVSFRKEDVLDLDEINKYDLIVSFSCLYYVKYQKMGSLQKKFRSEFKGKVA